MSENKKIHKTMIGGQAVIEGVVMKGVKDIATAVRLPSGEIDIKVEKSASIKDRFPILKLPILRGAVNFIEMMIFGYKSLTYSAEKAGLDDFENPSKFELWLQNSFGGKGMNVIMYFSLFIGVLFAMGLFIFLPAFSTKFLSYLAGSAINNFRTIIEGIIRLVIFFIYLYLVSKMEDIRRVLEYHGAEHKSIHCYEAGLELTPENAKGFTRLHPRCGTSFLFIAMICGIIVFSFVTWNNIWVRIALKILLMPLVVGFSYEIIRFAGKYDNWFTRIISWPGMMFQKFTTKEPDEQQLEVALASLKAVLTDNREDDKW